MARAAEIGDSIIAVTMDLLTEHGVDFSMDQVAATAGISKQAIYRRWPSKTDLVVHVIDRQIELVLDRVRNDLPEGPRVALHEVAWRIFDEDSKFANRITIFLQAEGLRNEALRLRFLRWSQLLHAFVADHVARTCEPPLGEEEAMRLAAILQDLLVGARNRVLWSTQPAAGVQDRFEERWASFEILLDNAGAR